MARRDGKGKKKRKERRCHIMVINHGRSESHITAHVKSSLKIKMEIVDKNSGKNSIQINSLNNILNKRTFSTESKFKNEYKDIAIDDNFKMFIIMDIDDCSNDDFIRYKNKDMFRGHWAYRYIVPIYNKMNLEDVMRACDFIDKDFDDKSTYKDIFPINKTADTNVEDMELMSKKLKENKKINNMYKFIDYSIKVADKNRI